MAWPKRGTRKLVVDGEDFLWHYNACCPLCSNDVFTVGQQGSRFVLFIDPLPWGFEFRPKAVVDAIRWALADGWTPERGPTRAMAWSDQARLFEWLTEGRRHTECSIAPASEQEAVRKYGDLEGRAEWAKASRGESTEAASPSNDRSRIWTMFLDFDGVLNNAPFLRHQRNHPPSGEQQLFDPANIAALNRLCADLPVSSIVVSSSWRTDRGLNELRFLLSKEGFEAPGLLDAVTGHVSDDAEGRAAEVAAYVKEMDLEDWFALDDFDLQPYLDSRVPRIHGTRGMTTEVVAEIVTTLKLKI